MSKTDQIPTIDLDIYRLEDYPMLAQIARKQTDAQKLDARACRYIYASNNVDVSTLTETEKAFFNFLFNHG